MVVARGRSRVARPCAIGHGLSLATLGDLVRGSVVPPPTLTQLCSTLTAVTARSIASPRLSDAAGTRSTLSAA